MLYGAPNLKEAVFNKKIEYTRQTMRCRYKQFSHAITTVFPDLPTIFFSKPTTLLKTRVTLNPTILKNY